MGGVWGAAGTTNNVASGLVADSVTTPAGTTSIDGYVRPGQTPGLFSAPDDPRTRRFFTLDPGANFLYAANQDSDTIVTFRVNKATGKLAPTGQIVKVGSPVTIVFAGA